MDEDNGQSSNKFWRWELGDLGIWLSRYHYIKANFVTSIKISVRHDWHIKVYRKSKTGLSFSKRFCILEKFNVWILCLILLYQSSQYIAYHAYVSMWSGAHCFLCKINVLFFLILALIKLYWINIFWWNAYLWQA